MSRRRFVPVPGATRRWAFQHPTKGRMYVLARIPRTRHAFVLDDIVVVNEHFAKDPTLSRRVAPLRGTHHHTYHMLLDRVCGALGPGVVALG